jgi:two-component system, NarL family, response regulator EvgA
VLIVDDHPVVRLAVRLVLEQHGYSIVGEADNGVDALQITREVKPDLIILDINIPKLDGLELIPRLRTQEVCPRILVLTTNATLANRCMQLGASGFISKDEDLQGIVRALDSIRAGYAHFPQNTFSSVSSYEVGDEDHHLISSLTDREVMVLKQLAQGLSNKQIADQMLLSNKTISTYKVRILFKLKAQSVLDLADFARRNMLI